MESTKTKRCYRCKQVKPVESFYRDAGNGHADGRKSMCKACDDLRRRVARAKDPEKYRAMQRAQYQRLRATRLRYAKRYVRLHQDRIQAQALLRAAVYFGILTKKPCSVCGDEKSEAHHPDYTRPLDVIWLCHPHHMEIQHSKSMLLIRRPRP